MNDFWKKEISLKQILSEIKQSKLFGAGSEAFKKIFDLRKEIGIHCITLMIALVIISISTIVLLANMAVGNLKVYNCVITIIVFSALSMIIRRYHISLAITSALIMLVYYVDQFVYIVRSVHISYQDFAGAGDAVRVANRYSLVMTPTIAWHLVLVVVLNVIYVIGYQLIYKNNPVKGHKAELIVSLCIFVIASLFGYDKFIRNSRASEMNFDVNSYTESYGLLYSWLQQYRHSKVEKPDGYTKEYALEILGKYESIENSDKFANSVNKEADEAVDIIMIMNESFTDYDLVGKTDFSRDPLPYLHSLEDNCVKGKMVVSVMGGGTCNSEFEFLTGSSMAFLPEGSYPYVKFIHTETPSICSDLSDNYYCQAIHPYYGVEWKRTTVYPLLGFDEFTSIEELVDAEKEPSKDNITSGSIQKVEISDMDTVRGFVSDSECNRIIMNSLNEDNSNCVFTVTIQNHGGYLTEDFESESYTENDELNEYLTCSHYSDIALEELLEGIESSNRKTVVVMFGDHQPSIKTTNIEYSEELQEKGIDKYIVLYVIWTNYDMKQEAIPQYDLISINYLSAYCKQVAGIPLTSWDRQRIATMEEYPVVSPRVVINKDGKIIANTESEQLLKEYQMVQYYRLFDYK